MTAVICDNLAMTFRAPVRAAGLGAALRSFVVREYREITAVQALSFTIERGEVVGFIGPNGAGKTTTLKMLCGILHPTAGTATVLGWIPWQRKRAFLRQIAVIRGSQPLGGPGELTVMDALRFQQLVYEVPDADFRRNLAELVELLDITTVLDRQVRALSLGERMRAGLALALIYRPQLLLLDEPTIGLDVSAVGMVRRFIAEYTRTTQATVMLTSHYMADVETLCNRVLLIDHGQIAYDGPLAHLTQRLSPYKLLTVTTPVAVDWARFGTVLSDADGTITLRVPFHDAPATTARILAEVPVADLAVASPPLESIMDQVYREGIAS